MDCRDFLRLAEASRQGDLSRYAWALFEWHRRTCPRCAAAIARATISRPAPPAKRRAPLTTRTV
jgi:hypothetical protein